MPTFTQQSAVFMRRVTSPISYDDRVSEFNPVIWLDEFSDFYQDAGTTPADAAGEVVGQWTDRSGNDLHASASGSARPPLVASDGVLIPDLDGTNHYLEIANDAAWASLTRWTILTRVSADTAGGGGNGYLWDMAGTPGDYDLRFEGALTSLRLKIDNVGLRKAQFITTSGVDSGVETWLWATYEVNGTGIPLLRNPLLFGGAPTPVTGLLETPTSLFLGTHGSLANKFNGQYRAFMVFPTILSALNMRWIMNGAA